MRACNFVAAAQRGDGRPRGWQGGLSEPVPGLLAWAALAQKDREKAQARVTKDHLDAVEESIEMLKVSYERYFNGVDRVPPVREHEDVKRAVRDLAKLRGGTTVLRFRAQNLRARLVTYEHYWTRILGMIEKGTFKRVLTESARRERLVQLGKEPGSDAESAQAAGSSGQVAAAQSKGQEKTRTERPAAGSPPQRHQLPDGVDAKHARELYKQFVAAKKAAGEPTAGLTYGKLVDRLAREVPKLREKHGTDIAFEVSTVGGKVRLRARRQKTG